MADLLVEISHWHICYEDRLWGGNSGSRQCKLKSTGKELLVTPPAACWQACRPETGRVQRIPNIVTLGDNILSLLNLSECHPMPIVIIWSGTYIPRRSSLSFRFLWTDGSGFKPMKWNVDREHKRPNDPWHGYLRGCLIINCEICMILLFLLEVRDRLLDGRYMK